MRRATIWNIVLMGGAVAFVVSGFILAGVCGGGLALILFGVATGLIGGVVMIQGGYAVVIPTAILVLTLVLAGVYILGASGCSL